MNRFCIAAYVFGGYSRFIPFYIYSVLSSYRDYYVKIFLHGTLSRRERMCIELLRGPFGDRFTILENYRKNYPGLCRGITQSPDVLKTVRWLLPQCEFSGFRYAYIGDIDYMITREEPSMLQGHITHCSQTGLPYSNLIRKDSCRLSGLHFFHVESYYEKMTPLIDYYRHHPRELLQLICRFPKSPNETFLYHIVSRGIGVIEDIKDGRPLHYRPEHGFHLGNIRGGIVRRDSYLGRYENNRHLIAYATDNMIHRMLDVLPVIEVAFLLETLVNNPGFSQRVKRHMQRHTVLTRVKQRLLEVRNSVP